MTSITLILYDFVQDDDFWSIIISQGSWFKQYLF